MQYKKVKIPYKKLKTPIEELKTPIEKLKNGFNLFLWLVSRNQSFVTS